MPFSPSGLPTLPTCESDIARWAAELETYIVAKFTTAHNEIDNVVVSPFDICAELGSLSAPSCLIPAIGIDNTSFSYAAEGDTLVAGSGVLPWPGNGAFGIKAGRHGTATIPQHAGWGGPYEVPINPALSSTNYAVFTQLRTGMEGGLISIESKNVSSFTYRAQFGSTATGGPFDYLIVEYL